MPQTHRRRSPRVKGDFAVQYILGGKTQNAWATIHGGFGLFLKTPGKIQEGVTLTVLFRPAKNFPMIEARAIVRSRTSGEGVGIEFTSMRPEDHQRILRLIERRMEEQRTNLRAPFVAQIQYEGGTFLGLSRNISLGGIFVETSESRPIGSMLELRFHLDDGDPIIAARGEVAYVVPKRGIGVRFIDILKGEQDRIEKYVSKGIAEVPASGKAG